MNELESQGQAVATEEAALTLTSEIHSQAALSGVTLTSIQPMTRQSSTTGKTNLFFEEATVNISVSTGEKELIDFLYRLADKSMLIRAKSMTLGTDPGQMRLQGPITLVKSFQRKPPPKATTTAPSKPSSPPPVISSTPKPSTTPPPANTAAVTRPPPATIPAPPAPSGGTNRSRRALPSPVKP